jgi:hypothetical protein
MGEPSRDEQRMAQDRALQEGATNDRDQEYAAARRDVNAYRVFVLQRLDTIADLLERSTRASLITLKMNKEEILPALQGLSLSGSTPDAAGQDKPKDFDLPKAPAPEQPAEAPAADGDGENILIARARGQTGLTIAGTSISLDLGKNVWLDAADEELLSEYEAARKGRVHTDKVVVDAMGSRYLQDDRGGRGSKSADYVRDDRVPGYFAGMPGKPRG